MAPARNAAAAMSGTRPAGMPRESSTSRVATSPASTGWNWKPVGAGITGILAMPLAIVSSRSWNWVARRVVHGSPESATMSSAARLDA